MKRKIVILFLFLIILLTLIIHNATNNDELVVKNDNFTVNSVNLSNYTNIDGTAVFNTQIFVTNNSDEDKYFTIKGDFETEYKLFMIKDRVLDGYEPDTGYKIYFLPANTYTAFDVSFSGDSYKNRKKPNRLPPEIIIEELDENEVDNSEIVTNIAMKDDGTMIDPENP